MTESGRRTILRLLALVALGIALTACVAPPGNPHYDPGNQGSLRRADDLTVLSFNIHYILPSEQSRQSWMERRENVVELIRRQRAGIVALQEVRNRSDGHPLPSEQLTYLRAELTEYAFAAAEPVGLLSAQPVLYDPALFRLVDEGFLHMTVSGEQNDPRRWQAWSPRFVSWALLEVTSAADERGGLDGTRLWVVNVHFDNLSGPSRRASVRIVADFLDDVLEPDDAALIAGDFNTYYWTSSMRTLFDVGFQHALPVSRTGSFHAFTGVTLWPRVDHILINRRFESLGGTLIYDRYEEGYPSDHFPAIAYLRWR